MFFRTAPESLEWAGITGDDLWKREAAPSGKDLRDSITVFFDKKTASYALAGLVGSWLEGFDMCLFLVDEFGVWPSSENLHLYYRLRRSYGDNRHLSDAPGHQFLKHEGADLATFIDLAIQFGWGGYLFLHPNDTQVRISHDSWVQIFTTEVREKILTQVSNLKLMHRLGGANG